MPLSSPLSGAKFERLLEMVRSALQKKFAVGAVVVLVVVVPTMSLPPEIADGALTARIAPEPIVNVPPATLMVPPESLRLLLARLATPVLKLVDVTATFAVSPPAKSLEYVVNGWMPLVAEYVAKSVPMPPVAS